MKLALTLDIWDPSRGGLEAYADALVRSLADFGHEVAVVTVGGTLEELERRGVRIERVEGRGVAVYRAADARCRELSSDGFRILSFRHPGAADVFLPLGGLLVSSLAARRRAEPAWLRAPRRLARAASARTRAFLERERRFFETDGLVLANSKLVGDAIRAQFPRFSGRVEVVGLPVDFDVFCIPSEGERLAARSRIGAVHEDDVVLLFVGHDLRRKGFRVARAVVALLERRKIRVKLLVAGRGTERVSGRSIVGLGQTANVDAMVDLYHTADLLLAPSLEDNLSLCSLEALATGLPVVTTQSNGISSYLVDRDVGRAVEVANDVSSVDAATLALLDRSALDAARRKARRAAIASCERQRHFARVEALLAPTRA